ncbi:MAG: cytidylate kinase family protein [Nanoarchaeota archaeon]|nr:cytidylate kinase family protein [Nanoarchaeota archaeon]
MIITLAGNEGSGKTTLAKLLAKELNYKFYSIGDLRGKMAQEKNMTIDELNKIGEKEDWTDKEVDNYQKTLGQKEDNFVIEGRLSWYFIPQSKKIFLKVDPKTGARRIFLDQREDEKKVATINSMIEYICERRQSDDKRYKKYYGVDINEKENYDLIIDTTNKTPQEILKEIIKYLKNETNI